MRASAALLRLSCATLFLLLTACGGGSGSQPTPVITSISPTAVTAGGQPFVLTVMGGDFPAGAVITWNGSNRETQTINSGELQAQIYPSDIKSSGTVTIAVATLGQNRVTSAGVTLTINNPVPQVTTTSPNIMAAGANAFTLSVRGSNFTGNSVVNWNGSPRATTFSGDSTLITAAITAADVTSLQTATITVNNPAPGGGLSGSVYLPVYILTSLTANDIAWDSTNQVLYASVPSSATSHANAVVSLDPDTGSILASQPAGTNPDRLALSGADEFLYVGEDTSSAIQRFTLPALTPDISWTLGSDPSLGAYFPVDIQVAPGAPHTVAVSLGNNGVSPGADGGVVIYDDSTARATKAPGFAGVGPSYLYDSLQWGATDSVLFGGNNETSGGDFYILSVTSSGVTVDSDVAGRLGVFQNNALHFDAGTGDLFDDGGVVLDQTGASLGVFKPAQTVPGAIAVDSSINRAYMISDAGGGLWGFDIESYDLTTRQPIGIMQIAGINLLTASKLVRWGPDGLALLVNNGFVRTGQILLIKGQFVH